MFNNLFDFSIKKDWKQALVFYIFYAISIILTGGIIGIFLGLLLVIISKIGMFDLKFAENNLSFMKNIGFYIYDVFYHSACIILALLFIFKKSLKDFLSIILLISVVLLSIFNDALFALIPTTILSVFPNRNISE